MGHHESKIKTQTQHSRPLLILTSSGLYLNMSLTVHQLGQWAAETERCGCGCGLFASIEHTPVAVLFGQSRQSINVEVNLCMCMLFFAKDDDMGEHSSNVSVSWLVFLGELRLLIGTSIHPNEQPRTASCMEVSFDWRWTDIPKTTMRRRKYESSHWPAPSYR